MMRAAALSLLLVLALTGCGTTSSSTEFEGEEANVAAAVDDLESAGERKDEARICDEIVTRQLAERMAARGSTCEKEVEKAVKDADSYALDVRDVTIQGTTATARVTNEGRTAILELTRVGRDWRIDSLGR